MPRRLSHQLIIVVLLLIFGPAPSGASFYTETTYGVNFDGDSQVAGAGDLAWPGDNGSTNVGPTNPTFNSGTTDIVQHLGLPGLQWTENAEGGTTTTNVLHSMCCNDVSNGCDDKGACTVDGDCTPDSCIASGNFWDNANDGWSTESHHNIILLAIGVNDGTHSLTYDKSYDQLTALYNTFLTLPWLDRVVYWQAGGFYFHITLNGDDDRESMFEASCASGTACDNTIDGDLIGTAFAGSPRGISFEFFDGAFDLAVARPAEVMDSDNIHSNWIGHREQAYLLLTGALGYPMVDGRPVVSGFTLDSSTVDTATFSITGVDEPDNDGLEACVVWVTCRQASGSSDPSCTAVWDVGDYEGSDRTCQHCRGDAECDETGPDTTGFGTGNNTNDAGGDGAIVGAARWLAQVGDSDCNVSDFSVDGNYMPDYHELLTPLDGSTVTVEGLFTATSYRAAVICVPDLVSGRLTGILPSLITTIDFTTP